MPSIAQLRSSAALENGAPFVDVQHGWDAAALDGSTQHFLAGACVLIWHPAAMDQEPAVIIHNYKEVAALAA